MPTSFAVSLRCCTDNPQRAPPSTQLATRAQQIALAQQRQHARAHMGLALKQEYEMKQFAEAETRKFEAAVANELPETVRAVRDNVFDVAERHYGVPKETLQAIYSGEQQVSSAALMRSSAFQQMVFDAVKFRLWQQSLRDHAVRPVQNVQRPGVADERPKVYARSLGTASDLSLPGGSERQQGISNAAIYLTAHRARR